MIKHEGVGPRRPSICDQKDELTVRKNFEVIMDLIFRPEKYPEICEISGLVARRCGARPVQVCRRAEASNPIVVPVRVCSWLFMCLSLDRPVARHKGRSD